MNGVYVMWLREVKRFLRSRARMIGALGQPLLFLVALGYGLGPVFAKAGQGNYLEFIAPGIIGMAIIFTSIFNGMQMIWDRQFGFLKETMVAPVSRLSIMFGRTLGGASVATMQGLLVLVIAVIAGFRPVSLPALLPALLVMLLVALLFSALGMVVASRLKDMQGFQLIMNFLVMPLFFLSGALFPLSNAPRKMVWIARFDPLAYGVDALRHFLIGVSAFGIATDIAVLGVVTAFLLWLGSHFFSRMEV
ncbi:MAG TPA: ABC transporter permease [Rhizomicrobium sp.]|nr:ABC transporter permease [Rhizomicrobium sp.]